MHPARILTRLLLAPSLAAPGFADILTVSDNGPGDFTQIQAAVDAAMDGDVIRIATGTYQPFVIVDKELTLVGEDNVITGSIGILDLGAGKTVSMHGISGLGDASSSSASGLFATNNEGSIRVAGCEFSTDWSGALLGGAHFENCGDVVMIGTTVHGGGAGLRALDSQLALYDSVVIGGMLNYYDGYTGVIATGTYIRAEGSSLRGGNGLVDEESDGGDVLQLSNCTVELLQSSLTPGKASCDYGWGTFCGDDGGYGTTTGVHYEQGANSTLSVDSDYQVTIKGEAGQEVFLLASYGGQFADRAGIAGVLAIGQPPLPTATDAPVGVQTGMPPGGISAVSLGVAPAGGFLTAAVDLPSWLGAAPDRPVHLQAMIKRANDAPLFSEPAIWVSEGCFPGGDDCDMNGVVDACEIAGGAASDCDNDGIPDVCELDSNNDGTPDECELANTRVYVSAAAPPGGDGASWATALNDLNDGLQVADSLSGLVEIWVAGGVYKPDGDLTFSIKPGWSLYGGFAGNETSLSERDPDAISSRLEGDIQGNDHGQTSFVYSDNSSTVVRFVLGGGQHLDGFTVTGGYAPNAVAGRIGAGIHVDHDGEWSVANCRFRNNVSWFGGNAIFAESTGTIANCFFGGNDNGEGYNSVEFYPDGGELTVTNCVFAGAPWGGLVMESYGQGSHMTVLNSTFYDNFQYGAGHYADTGPDSSAEYHNCVFWENGDGTEGAQIWNDGPVAVTYSCVQGLTVFSGAGNIGFDPMFTNPAGVDGVQGSFDDDLRVPAGSPVIDAGRNAWIPADTLDLDQDGDTTEQLPVDHARLARRWDDPNTPDTGLGTSPLVDMGAFEFPTCEQLTSDCNQNGLSDLCEIENGTALDCDDDGIPDECEPDLDGNGEPDDCQAYFVLYVDADVPVSGDGLTWTTAFRTVWEALGELLVEYPHANGELWVAEGTYTPFDASQGFRVHAGTALYGGFSGTETSRDQRDHRANVTVLSGDQAGDDQLPFLNQGDNNTNVVLFVGPDGGQHLDGFFVTGGHTTSIPVYRNGGGLAVLHDEYWSVANCTFWNNYGVHAGSALWADGPGDLTNCAFMGNGGAWPSTTAGGAAFIVARAARPTHITNCAFVGGFNGGLRIDAWTLDESSTIVSNCTFANNENGGLRSSGTSAQYNRTLDVYNCVLWGNFQTWGTTEDAQLWGGPTSVMYSCIEGLNAWTATGNIGTDPLLIDVLGPDGIRGTLDDDARLGAGSAAIDAGRNAWLPNDPQDLDLDGDTLEQLPLDLDLNTRRVDDPNVVDTGQGTFPIVDMGAYERQ